MPKLDPPFPSFTLMMHEYQNDSLRLPSYRESLVVRFHPYPRKQSKSEALMQKVDYRYEEPAPAQDEEVTPPTPTEEGNNVALCLDRAMSKEKDGDVGVKRRRSLTALIIDLALAVRNGYRTPRLGKRRSSVSKDV
ncbi:uncharacterized protein TRAVEDRAFT_63913 [Trametes versicolor FP-101664 SS1]|uniref:uncharacterized protein n=1 Tax=Trametes versicolor (strain FP-101664) TaxID=717944 RepID=UPI00046222D7|nr:uncharacterized protein TRAVEDRAFT_63913 [Trametes versicolor FP-101664 SS1]EIW60337.1 hypothetical protein TRAVEDRAFT_63913 [Trametes versicolor FP-101664 SS1]